MYIYFLPFRASLSIRTWKRNCLVLYKTRCEPLLDKPVLLEVMPSSRIGEFVWCLVHYAMCVHELHKHLYDMRICASKVLIIGRWAEQKLIMTVRVACSKYDCSCVTLVPFSPSSFTYQPTSQMHLFVLPSSYASIEANVILKVPDLCFAFAI